MELVKLKKKIGEAMEMNESFLLKDFNRVPPQKSLVGNQITKAEERSGEEELTQSQIKRIHGTGGKLRP